MSTVTKVNSLHAVSKPAMIGETLYLDAKSIPPSFNVQDFIGMDSSQAIAVASKWRMPPVTVEKVNTSYAVERPYIIKGTLYLNPAHIPADADVDRLVGRIGMDAIKLASGWKE